VFLGLPDKRLVFDPFWPVIISLIAQIIFLRRGKQILGRAEGELERRGIPADQPVKIARWAAEGYSLANQIYAGTLPLLGVLMITVIGAKVTDTVRVTLIFVVLIIVCFWLVGLLGSSLTETFEDFNTKEHVPRHEKVLLWLRFDSFGALYEWVVIVLTLAAQLLVAYLQLPDKTS
jgi:hypothetical protein